MSSTTPTHYQTTTRSPPPGEKFEHGANKTTSGIRSAAAKIHGVGEAIRGHSTAAVDSAMKDPEGAQKNLDIAHSGEREINTGHFDSGRGQHERNRMERDNEGFPMREQPQHESSGGFMSTGTKHTSLMNTGETGKYAPTGHTSSRGGNYSGLSQEQSQLGSSGGFVSTGTKDTSPMNTGGPGTYDPTGHTSSRSGNHSGLSQVQPQHESSGGFVSTGTKDTRPMNTGGPGTYAPTGHTSSRSGNLPGLSQEQPQHGSSGGFVSSGTKDTSPMNTGEPGKYAPTGHTSSSGNHSGLSQGFNY